MSEWEDAPNSKVWETAPDQRKPLPLNGRMARFIAGNLNKGIASVPDSLLNTPNRVMNLGKAAYGTAATAMGRPDLAPQLTPDPDLVEKGMEKAGMITPEATVADTRGQRLGALGLQIAGGMTVPMGTPKPGTLSQIGEQGVKQAAERAAQREAFNKTLTESRKLGYVVPPSQVSSSATGNVLEGMVARTAPTERLASLKNAQVTNRIMRNDLQLGQQPLTMETLEKARTQAGKAYQEVKQSGVPVKADAEYSDALQKIKTSDYSQAAKEFPELLGNEAVDNLVKGLSKKEMSTQAAVELTKELRRRATKNIKAWDNLEKQDLGYAQRSAADALEGLIDRNLTSAGKGSLVKNWKEARKQIAKLHDAESVFDEASGNFSAREIAKLADKGKPLSGGMAQIAQFAKAFPKAAQDAEKVAQKSGVSQYDLGLGAAAAFGTGHVPALAAAAIPATMQHALLSRPGQAMFASPGSAGLGMSSLGSIDPIIQRAILQSALQQGK